MAAELVASSLSHNTSPFSSKPLADVNQEIPLSPPPSPWVRLGREFLRCHRRPLNVTLHLLTTPLGVFGILAIANLISPYLSLILVALYITSLYRRVPLATWFATTVVVSGLLQLAILVPVGWLMAVTMVVAGYFGQDVAHWVTAEKSFQSTYVRQSGVLRQFINHTFLLLPILLVIAARRRQSPLRLLVSRKGVLWRQLKAEHQHQDMQSISQWVNEFHPNPTQSTHWWQHELAEPSLSAFDRLSHDSDIMTMIRRFHGPGYVVEPVLGMNELYVTGPPKVRTSDTVFYMGHVDGPWAVFPGASLYRCMLAVSPNAEVTTHYPMSNPSYDQPESYRLETGDVAAFDFNRELHYITRSPERLQDEPRVNLKLHFVAYPRRFRWYGQLLARLTTMYDIRARNLFLQTIKPTNKWDKLRALWVLGWTKFFELAVRFVGWTNLAFVIAMGAISWLVSDFRWFLATTSFVHYAIYLGTFRERNPISFGTFRRNAIFFKTVSLVSLFLVYSYSIVNQPLSPTVVGSLATVIAGFALATYATCVLGVARTYFSAELGFDQPQRVTRFPYRVIPHPMIIGASVAIAAMGLVSGFRETYAWLIVGHLIGYGLVLWQEIRDKRLVSQQG